MKKLISALLTLTILFPTVGTLAVDSADAKGYSSGRSSFSGSSSSKSSFGSSSKSTSTPKSSSSSSSKSSSTKSSTSKPSKSISKSYSKESKAKAEKAKANAKYKSSYKSKYYKPSGYSYKKYNGKSYYNSSSGFSTNIMTAVGTYLLLDSFDDDGEPIYIDSETGEEVEASELDSLTAEDEVQSTSNMDFDDEQEDSSNGWMIAFIVLSAIVLLGILFVAFM